MVEGESFLRSNRCLKNARILSSFRTLKSCSLTKEQKEHQMDWYCLEVDLLTDLMRMSAENFEYLSE